MSKKKTNIEEVAADVVTEEVKTEERLNKEFNADTVQDFVDDYVRQYHFKVSVYDRMTINSWVNQGVLREIDLYDTLQEISEENKSAQKGWLAKKIDEFFISKLGRTLMPLIIKAVEYLSNKLTFASEFDLEKNAYKLKVMKEAFDD